MSENAAVSMGYKNWCWWLKSEFIVIELSYFPGGSKKIDDSITKNGSVTIIMMGIKHFLST